MTGKLSRRAILAAPGLARRVADEALGKPVHGVPIETFPSGSVPIDRAVEQSQHGVIYPSLSISIARHP